MHDCSLKKATQDRQRRDLKCGESGHQALTGRVQGTCRPPILSRLALPLRVRGVIVIALMDVKGVEEDISAVVASYLDLGLCKQATRSHGAFEGFVGAGIGVKRFDRRGTRLFGVVEGAVAWPPAT